MRAPDWREKEEEEEAEEVAAATAAAEAAPAEEEEETFYHVTILINPEAKNLQNFTALVKTLIIFQKLLRMKNVNWSTLHPTTIHTQIMQLSLLKKTLTYILKSPCQ